MPEYPEEKPKTISAAKYSVSFGGGIPIVKSISGYFLSADGWHHQKGNTYTKENNTITFDGVHWELNGKTRVEFMHELKHELNKNNGDNS